jgi:hypothetical protein
MSGSDVGKSDHTKLMTPPSATTPTSSPSEYRGVWGKYKRQRQKIEAAMTSRFQEIFDSDFLALFDHPNITHIVIPSVARDL